MQRTARNLDGFSESDSWSHRRMKQRQLMLGLKEDDDAASAEGAPAPLFPILDEQPMALHRTFTQRAESNANTQRRMGEECLRQAGGGVEAAQKLFWERMAASHRRNAGKPAHKRS